MAQVKWIKVTTNIFEDEKIDFILSLPEGDSILLIWIRFLTLAGKCNSKGSIFLTEDIPYTDDMLAHKFKSELNIVKLALSTFEKLGMIQIDEKGYIYLSNWEKHQNIEGLEKIREQNRNRVTRYREKQKQIEDSSVTCNVTVTEGNATDIDKELDLELELDKELYKTIVEYLNKKTSKNFKHTTKATTRLIKARINEGFTLDDFIKVIDTKATTWLMDPNMSKFMRPETLFGTKFESYLNEKPKFDLENNEYGW